MDHMTVAARGVCVLLLLLLLPAEFEERCVLGGDKVGLTICCEKMLGDACCSGLPMLSFSCKESTAS